MFGHFQFAFIHGPDIPGSYVILLFITLDLASLFQQSHPQLCVVFFFGSIFSFFLQLFLHRSPVAYWTSTGLGSSSFSVLFAFYTVHGVLKAGILKRFAISFSSGPCFFRTLHHDLSVWGDFTWHGSLFHIVWQSCEPCDQFWLVFCNCGFHSFCPLMDEDKSLV